MKILRINSAIRTDSASAIFIQFGGPNDEESRRVHDQFLRNIQATEVPLDARPGELATRDPQKSDVLLFPVAG